MFQCNILPCGVLRHSTTTFPSHWDVSGVLRHSTTTFPSHWDLCQVRPFETLWDCVASYNVSHLWVLDCGSSGGCISRTALLTYPSMLEGWSYKKEWEIILVYWLLKVPRGYFKMDHHIVRI
jgi:hypothetical protein